MHLHCLGLNHHTAEVSIREKLAFDEQDILNFWNKLNNKSIPLELVVLSTCNRVEIYVASEEPIFEIIEGELSDQGNIPQEQINASFYRLVDEQVVSHLFRVAAGLDSMVLGEPQILGQVTEAYEIGLKFESCGKILSKLFQTAIQTGKRVRTETAISRNSTSISSLAARLAAQIVPNLPEAQITLFGAGEMAELTVEALRKRGVKNFNVISRTINSACTLAKRWNGQAGTMDSLKGVLEDTDILITSTSAPHTLLNKGMIAQIMKNRPDRPMVIIDIAVPRDVDPEVDTVPNAQVYDIDRLYQEVEQSLEKRSNEIPKVEKILEEEYLHFKDFWGTLKVVPTIVDMRQMADNIRIQELEKTLNRLPDLGEFEQEKIVAMTRSIVQKILHAPTVGLRQKANEPDGEKYASAVRVLFGLDHNQSSEN